MKRLNKFIVRLIGLNFYRTNSMEIPKIEAYMEEENCHYRKKKLTFNKQERKKSFSMTDILLSAYIETHKDINAPIEDVSKNISISNPNIKSPYNI
jgi:hypothetical protein